jgi:polyisoprenoid-binding protein YceI
MATPLVNATVVPGYTTGKWQIDAAHSEVAFVVRHMVVAKVRGRFTQFQGEIVSAADPSESTVSVTIDAASIDTSNEQRDGHVKSADFLDVENFPEITFRSTAVHILDGDLAINGDITIKGVTRPVTLRAESHGVAEGAMGDTRAGFSATADIDRTEFGVTFNGPLPGGGMILSEKVQLFLDVALVLDQD